MLVTTVYIYDVIVDPYHFYIELDIGKRATLVEFIDVVINKPVFGDKSVMHYFYSDDELNELNTTAPELYINETMAVTKLAMQLHNRLSQYKGWIAHSLDERSMILTLCKEDE